MNRIILSAFTGCNHCYKNAVLYPTNLAEVINRQIALPEDTGKCADWKIYPYISADNHYHGKDASTYIGTGVILMDIDSKEVYSVVRDRSDEFFTLMPSILIAWPSFSHKLHLAILVPCLQGLQGDALAEEYKRQYSLHMCRFIESYKALTDKDIYNLKEGNNLICDSHNAKLSQAIALNHIDEFFANPYAKENDELQSRTSELMAKYPLMWGLTSGCKSKVGEIEEDRDASLINVVSAKEQGGKYLIDKHFCIKGFCGNDARFRIARAVLDGCNGNVSKAESVVRSRFINADEIIANLSSVKDYKTNKDIEQWVRQYVIRVYEADKVITLGEGQYVSDYVGDIMYNITLDGKNVYIKAGCGIGKSTLYKRIFKEQGRVIIIVHMNSLKEGVFGNCAGLRKYIITTKQMKSLIRRGDILPQKMIMVWNTYQLIVEHPRYSMIVDDYIKLLDESHNLVTSLDYRHKTIYAITSRPFAKTIFCSATPAGEHVLLGGDVAKYEFVKSNSRTTTYTQLIMSDDQGALVPNERIKMYDYVRTVKDYIIENYDDYDGFLIYDNRNHERMAELFKDYAIDFCRNNRDKEVESVTSVLTDNSVKRKVFVTTSFGTEGIEIKHREDDVKFDWERGEMVTEKNKVRRLCALYPVWNLTTTDVEQSINRFRDVELVDVIFLKSDDSREYLSWGVGQDVSLCYMSGALTDQTIRAEVKSFDRYYADSSTYFPSIKLVENTDEVLILSRLQYNHKHFNSLTSKNLQIMYPSIKVIPYQYAYADNERDINALRTYRQFRHDNYRIYFNTPNIDADELEDIAGNYTLNGINDNWERTAVARKAMRNDVEAVKDIMLQGCDLEEGKDVELEFRRGLMKLAGVFVYADGLHLDVMKKLLKTRFLFLQGDEYLKEVGDNAEQRQASEQMKRWYYKRVGELGLSYDLTMSNYEWVCALADCEIMDVKRDKRGRKSEKKYKFGLIVDESVRFFTKEEAFEYIQPEGIEISSFIRRKWVEYIRKL